MKEHAYEELKLMMEDKAAVVIQAVIRGHVTRRQHERLKVPSRFCFLALALCSRAAYLSRTAVVLVFAAFLSLLSWRTVPDPTATTLVQRPCFKSHEKDV